MKQQIRVLLSLMVAAVILLAISLSAGAIGFEAEKAYESVFVIYSGNSLGSGFAVGENCIVTNAHVIDNKRNITVETYGGSKYSASVIGINEYEDIAVLAVADASFPYLKIADLSMMKTGDDIYAIGAPHGMAYTLTKGGISAKERTIGDQTYIQIDAPINEGNSGGPLLSDDGEVIGMNTLKMSDSEGIGLAIPIDRVCKYLESLDLNIDTSGNVTDRIDAPKSGDMVDDSYSGAESEAGASGTGKKGAKDSVLVVLLFIIAVLSVIANVLLATKVVRQKKQIDALKYNPEERTDFEIDILE